MDMFHKIALEEYLKAILENKECDSEHVKQRVYKRYEKELQEESDNR